MLFHALNLVEVAPLSRTQMTINLKTLASASRNVAILLKGVLYCKILKIIILQFISIQKTAKILEQQCPVNPSI